MGALASLSDGDLLLRAKALARAERGAAAALLAHLAEIHRRGAAVRAGFPSLFAFCVEGLKLSHGAAYARLQAVRVAERHPEIYALVRDGELNMTTVALIADQLERRPELLQQARSKSSREVERLLAEGGAVKERPDRVSFVMVAPKPPPDQPLLAADSAPALRAPASEAAVARVMAEIRFTAPEGFLASVERLKSLLWHKFPEGRLADVLAEAVSEFVQRRDPQRPRRPSVSTPGPSAKGRRIPAAVKRAVQRRDGQRCTFIGPDGRRCGETRGLEIDHAVPFALGGASEDPANLRLLCRAHNQAERERWFGRPNRGG